MKNVYASLRIGSGHISRRKRNNRLRLVARMSVKGWARLGKAVYRTKGAIKYHRQRLEREAAAQVKMMKDIGLMQSNQTYNLPP